MHLVPEDELAQVLRGAVDGAKLRLWIASPYIGEWAGNVRRILGTKWQSVVGDVRLLTDIEAEGWRLSTVQQCGRRGSVRSLLGLHAKLYVVDDVVFLGSANLTGTAFSRRYETLVRLTGAPALGAATQFEKWWKIAAAVDVDGLQDPVARSGSADPGEVPGKSKLPHLRRLPPDVADEAMPGAAYGDYGDFLACYRELGTSYAAAQGGRLWKDLPLYMEVDAFLDFLFHRDPPVSKPYTTKEPRALTDKQKAAELKKWAGLFATEVREGRWSDTAWRKTSMREVQRVLTKGQKAAVTRHEFAALLSHLNSMSSYQINLAKATSAENNSMKDIRHALALLGDKEKPVRLRLAEADRLLFGVSKSALQEIVGFNEPHKFPLRNRNTNAGLRFLGYQVRAS